MTNITRRPSTVGEIIRREFLRQHGLNIKQMGDLLGIHRNTAINIMAGRSGISPLMAFKLSKLFGPSPEFWLNLQREVDFWEINNDPVAKAQLDQITTLPVPEQTE